MPHVFVYGPDSLQARIFDRVGPSEVIGGAIAPGYRLTFDKPSFRSDLGLANLVRADGGRAFGVLYDLTRAQIERLDGYYGGYGREDLAVEVITPADGADIPKGAVKAQAFIARRVRAGLSPLGDAVADTERGARENGAPPEFLSALEPLLTAETKRA